MTPTTLLAIDPGTDESAYVNLDVATRRVRLFGTVPNEALLPILAAHESPDTFLVIEQVACYGMRVGREVFETCYWCGRFAQRWATWGGQFYRITRKDVVVRLCHSARANDADVRAKLIDIYGPGKALAVGLKATPGPLYGMKGDEWAALAVAIAWHGEVSR